jgi:hypothetical protein
MSEQTTPKMDEGHAVDPATTARDGEEGDVAYSSENRAANEGTGDGVRAAPGKGKLTILLLLFIAIGFVSGEHASKFSLVILRCASPYACAFLCVNFPNAEAMCRKGFFRSAERDPKTGVREI